MHGRAWTKGVMGVLILMDKVGGEGGGEGGGDVGAWSFGF